MPAAVFILGPTAAGKSELALRLAQKIGGEIISVDSMQVYRGLDIGTAKPSLAERAQTPHHLIDVAGLAEMFDAAQFVERAKIAAREIQARGHTAIFCGGTGLYFKAYLEGLGEAPPADLKLRAELEATPREALLKEIELKDPVLYAQMDRQNFRRILRALEVIRLTGQPYSSQRARWNRQTANDPAAEGSKPLVFGVQRPAEDLYPRINERVDRMFAAGLVAETEALLAQGLEQNRVAMQAIGYCQVAAHLRGELGLAETIDLIKRKTRKYAKRQMTWFRYQLPVTWLDAAGENSGEAMLETLCQAF
jgi:tRNA dimethylallyltransferase